MKFEELLNKSEDELKTLLMEQRKESLNLRFQQTTGELENTARVADVRHNIAQIRTRLSQVKKGIEDTSNVKKKAAGKKPAAKAKTTKKEAA